MSNKLHRFEGKTVLVTGASTGLGLAISRAFAAEGATLAILARTPDRLAKAADELEKHHGRRPLTLVGDVADRRQVDDLITQAITKLGPIDILVNNAGSGMIAPFESVPVADAISLFQTNFFGTLNCIQALLPHLQQQQRGHIINVSSLAGLRGIPNSSIYSASKAAVIALSDSLRIEVQKDNIYVTVICPSRIRLDDTNFFNTAKKYGPVELYAIPKDLTADTVAAALVTAAAKRSRLVILPFHARLMYFINKFAPRLIDRHLSKKMPHLSAGNTP